MGKFDGVLICSDIDGTLTDSYGKISVDNCRAIEYFQSEGGKFTVSTGRYHTFIEKFPIKVNAPVICVNGTVIYDSELGRVVWQKPVPDGFIADMEYICREYKDLLSGAYGCSLTSDIHWNSADGEFSPDIFGTNQLYKCVFVPSEHEKNMPVLQKELIAKFGKKYSFNRSQSFLLEMHHIESGKGYAVKELRKIIGNVHTVVAAGDYENDISMFAEADISFAPENSVPEVKSVANFFGPSNNEGFIAYIVDKLSAMF